MVERGDEPVSSARHPDDPYLGANDDDVGVHEYGQPRPKAWLTFPPFDGEMPVAPRRPELLDPTATANWWHDLTTWTVWAIRTFRLGRTFPPCWPQHPALVEELTALWLFWQGVWLPALDPGQPINFLQHLDWSLCRVERWWKVPCTTDGHKQQEPVIVGAQGLPDLHRWWGNPDYRQE